MLSSLKDLKEGADYFFSKSEDFENIPDIIMEFRNNEQVKTRTIKIN